jgi:thiol:disulfide interchange protein
MRATSLLMTNKFFIFVTVLLSAFWSPVAAQVPGVNNIKATLVAETRTPAAGSTVMLAIDMRPNAGWHGYWQNPGEAGFPVDLKWTLPTGLRVGALRFPVPERLVVEGLMNHVFNGEHALLVPLTLPSGLATGTRLPIRIVGDWLACTDKICVPERAELALDLVVGDGAIEASDRQIFDGWRMKLPKPLGTAAQFSVAGDTVRIGIPYPASLAADDAWFFASTDKAVAYLGPQKLTRSGDMLIVETKKAAFGFVSPKKLDGVLAVNRGQGFEISAAPGAVAGSKTGGDFATILLALGGAVLGGLLLNIMPCVFPIISLKAVGLARVGGHEGEAKREALAYAAGVILTCLALGGALLALRAGGTSVGWAFQLQDPRVILALLLLTTAIALNLAGLFHLRGFGGGEGLASKGGTSGAFWTGALAAFVATPCTGPFMAAALGAALVLPVAAALAIFAGLGFGLALPFLLLGFVPALRRHMPKPGPWMGRFQRWMSVPMFLTAVALVWLLWRQTGQGGLILALLAVAGLTGLLWFAAKKQPFGLSFGVLLIGVSVLTLGWTPLLPAVVQQQAVASLPGAEPFSEARLDKLRAEGRPVFAYFTADWCVTCKINEKAAIERDEVAKAFKTHNVAVLVGDWTNGDPALGRFLEANGRSGVPLYLFYPIDKAGSPAVPTVLPQVLTSGMLTRLPTS